MSSAALNAEPLTITHSPGTQWTITGPAAEAANLTSVLVTLCALHEDLDDCSAMDTITALLSDTSNLTVTEH